MGYGYVFLIVECFQENKKARVSLENKYLPRNAKWEEEKKYTHE